MSNQGWGPPPGPPSPQWGTYGMVPGPPQQMQPGCFGCGYQGPVAVVERVSQNGWIVFAVLLVTCLPLCWIGLLMKTSAPQCPNCRRVLGHLH